VRLLYASARSDKLAGPKINADGLTGKDLICVALKDWQAIIDRVTKKLSAERLGNNRSDIHRMQYMRSLLPRRIDSKMVPRHQNAATVCTHTSGKVRRKLLKGVLRNISSILSWQVLIGTMYICIDIIA
jgi:hypothetical protein